MIFLHCPQLQHLVNPLNKDVPDSQVGVSVTMHVLHAVTNLCQELAKNKSYLFMIQKMRKEAIENDRLYILHLEQTFY